MRHDVQGRVPVQAGTAVPAVRGLSHGTGAALRGSRAPSQAPGREVPPKTLAPPRPRARLSTQSKHRPPPRVLAGAVCLTDTAPPRAAPAWGDGDLARGQERHPVCVRPPTDAFTWRDRRG
jgi:hypothetical protein